MNDSNELTPAELQRLQQKASRPASVLPLAVVPATGIDPAEFLHLHRDWVSWPSEQPHTPNHPIIKIPDSEPCRRKKVKRGTNRPPTLVDRTRPCHNCRDRKTEPKFVATNRSEGNNTVPVADEYAAKKLKWWFKEHDTIPWAQGLVTLNTLAESEIGRQITLTDLRHTFVARAAKMELSIDSIADSTGMSPEWLRHPQSPYQEILKVHGDKGISDCHTYQDYLRVLDGKPTSAANVADILDVAGKTALDTLEKWESEGLVKQVGKTKHGSPIYENTVPPDAKLVCRFRDCSREFDTPEGRSNHERHNHQ